MAAVPQLLIRTAEPLDTPAVTLLNQAAFGPLRAIYRPLVPTHGETGELAPVRLVAFRQGRLVATVRYRHVVDRLHLIGLAVDPACRREGVCRALVEHCAGLARQRRCRCLSLYTVVQTGNVAIFERLGFQVIREKPAADMESPTGVPLTEAYMERPI